MALAGEVAGALMQSNMGRGERQWGVCPNAVRTKTCERQRADGSILPKSCISLQIRWLDETARAPDGALGIALP